MFGQEFYPTPRKLIDEMLSGIDFREISSVLEPSAGKCDIVERVVEKFKYDHSYGYNKDIKWDIDCVEIDENLQHIIKGKGFRVVDSDFLNFHTYKRYQLIVMNPPFSVGDQHLLKAISLAESNNGSQIVCLLNSETIKNPYSNYRKDLLRKLKHYNADIKFIENGFIDAERSTYVEVALIRLKVPKTDYSSVILDGLKKEEQFREKKQTHNTNVINADFMKGIVEQYNFEVKAGLRLIAEYDALKPMMLKSLREGSNSPVLNLSVDYRDKDDRYNSIENGYIKEIRHKYWDALFKSPQFMEMFTSNLLQKYLDKVNELKDYDFSLYNIYSIRLELNKDMVKGVEDTILALFDEFTHKHYYYEEMSKNIWGYNGWKTNNCFKINDKKVIIPLSAYSSYSWDNSLRYDTTVERKISDIEKVFNYLNVNGEDIPDINLRNTLQAAQKAGQTKGIVTKYATLDFYKKGTCHISFKSKELVAKFNLFAARKKNWMPPSYGKKTYKEMTNEEKEVINNFQGEVEYNKVMANKDYYIFETSKLLMLAQ